MPAGVFFTLILCFSTAPSAEEFSNEDSVLVETLQAMEFEELTSLEVKLDDTFDIFGTLARTRQAKLATGEPQAATRAPALVTIISAQDIEAGGASTLSEVLQAVPGLYIGGEDWRQRSDYIMRGMAADVASQHILFMLNGRPVKELISSIADGFIDADGLLLRNIARIEVIRGPASALYGADAFAGVINIITKNAADINGTESGVQLGSSATRELWLLHGRRYGGVDAAFSVNYRRTDGSQGILRRDRQTPFDEAAGSRFSFAPGPLDTYSGKFNTHLNLAYGNWEIQSWFQRSRIGLNVERSTLKPLSTNLQDVDTGLFSINYHRRGLLRHLDFDAKLSAGYFSAEDANGPRIAIPPGSQGFPGGLKIFTNFKEYSPRLDLNFFYSGLSNHLFRFGTGYMFTDLYKVEQKLNVGINPHTGEPIPPGSEVVDVSDTNRVTAPENIRKNTWLFVQDAWRFAPDWELTLGLRYDDYSDFGETINPRASLVWTARPDLSVKFLYGRAFLAPSLVNLFSRQAFFLGNPNLEPTHLNSLELAFDYQFRPNLHFALSVFSYQFNERIALVENIQAGFGNVYINSGQQEGKGFELEARWKALPTLGLIANYAFQHGTISTEDDIKYHIPNLPRHLAYLRFAWLPYPEWHFDTQMKWAGTFKRAENSLLEPVGDHLTVDLTLHHKPRREAWKFSAGIRNLFDKENRDPSSNPLDTDDLPLSGRSFFTELKYQF